jgi:RHS repeat-associated protein
LAAININVNGTDTMYFTETDHLGSIIGLLRTDGTVREQYSYDPWGRRRNPVDWSYNNVPTTFLIDRGFTGHEHLDKFGLINMNGRIYDPVLGRFLSADPVIQSPYSSQSFNGYSYCFNNPLKYIDPSGYSASAQIDDPDPWAAFIRARMRGDNRGYGEFCDDYYQKYYDYLVNDGGGLFGGSRGSTIMSFTYYTDSYSYGELIIFKGYQPIREVIVTSEKHSYTMSISWGLNEGKNNRGAEHQSWSGPSHGSDPSISEKLTYSVSTPGIEMEAYYKWPVYKGKSPIEYVKDFRTLEKINTIVTTPFFKYSFSTNGSFTIGNNTLRFGTTANNWLIVNLSIPWHNNSSIGLTGYYNLNGYEYIFNSIGGALSRPCPVIPLLPLLIFSF